VADEAEGTQGGGTAPGYGGRRRAGRPAPASGGGGGGYSGGGGGYSGGAGAGAGRPRRSSSGDRPFDPGPRAPRPMIPSTPEPESAKPARELLEQILQKMGIDGARVRYYARTEGEYFEVDGPDLANLIGRHGHTLEALNLIFNNIVNNGVKKDRKYFTIDAEGYRARRADMLKGLALQTLERAIREKRAIALEPMLPSERKVIHLALAENPFVTTESSGSEPERRVVVSPRSA
jgi:spoIIIJ-associated protein